jgi:hypothetical protein
LEKNENITSSQGSYIITGALGLGILGFILRIFDLLILTPESNQSPLIGILITGLVGVALGVIG